MNLYNLQQRYRAGAARRGQSGFTMVELAIVLVIAGIILVAALKGTDMINKAKIERTVSDMRGIQGMILEHEKRTGRLAGDCSGDGIIAVTQASLIKTYLGAAGAAATGYDNDPSPTTSANHACTTIAAADEADINVPWKDLRKANIVDPSRSNQVLAKNQTNDFYGIGSLTINGTLVNVITVHGIPLWMAKGIDVAIDGAVLPAANGGLLGRVRLLTDGTGADQHQGLAWPNNENDDAIVSISYQFDRMAPTAAAAAPVPPGP